MIKAEELMIGNYVICEQCTHVVTEIRKNRVRSKWINHPAEERDYECGFDELKPIPITEKILENFGFQNKKSINYVIKGMIIFKCDDMFICDKTGALIKSVHQLQNHYFALTGSKLSYTKNLNS